MDTKELLKKVRKIEIKTRRLSDNIFGGEYHSTFKGRGMTFSEVRQYQYGDDVRSIDWNVTARYNEPYVNFATKVMLGYNKVTDFNFKPSLEGYAIKQPVFSFNKFPNVNKQLGPEMKSTGESILFIDNLKEDEFYDLYARRKMYLTK